LDGVSGEAVKYEAVQLSFVAGSVLIFLVALAAGLFLAAS
jgi:hypothetical protein